MTEEEARPIGLERTRVIDLLTGAPVIVAHGSAGVGKTTFLRQRAAAWSDRVFWLDCDGLDRQSSTFERRLCRAFSEGAETLDDALRDAASTPLLIVVDDLERLDSAPSIALLEALVARLPAATQLALGTRSLEALPAFERWRSAGSLDYIGGQDLRFRLWEIDRLFREVHRIPLSVTELHAVSAASGGWSVALHYLAVSLRHAADPQRLGMIEAVGRSNVGLRRYLRSQVLASLRDDQREILRRLAVFDRVDVSRVQALAPGVSSVVVELADRGVLEEDPVSGTVRMHSLLRAEVLAELRAKSSSRLSALYLEAAEILESVGEPHEACLARARAGHPGVMSPDDDGDGVTLHAAATRALFAGNSHRAERLLARAVEQFDDDGGNPWARQQLRFLRDWLGPIRGEATSWVGELRLLLEGRPVSPSGERAQLIEAVALFLRDDPAAARRFRSVGAGVGDRLGAILADLGLGVVALRHDDAVTARAHGTAAWRRCRDDGSDAFALVAEAVILASEGSHEDLDTIVRLASERDDKVVAGVLALIAVVAREQPPAVAAEYQREATRCFEAAGFERVAAFLRLHVAFTRSPVAEACVAPSAGPDVDIRCLGALGVSMGGAPLPIEELRPIHRELLSVLAAQAGEPVHREEVIAALWPEKSLDRALGGLQTGVSALRRWFEACGDPLGRARIVRIGETYSLQLDPGCTDLGRLRAAVRQVDRRLRSMPHAEVVSEIYDTVGLYSDEPFRSLGPLDWAVDVRHRTRASIRALLLRVDETTLDTARRREWTAFLFSVAASWADEAVRARAAACGTDVAVVH